MIDFKLLIHNFEMHADAARAKKMEQYMKNQFAFYGIPAPERKTILSNWKKQNALNYSQQNVQSLFDLFSNYPREASYCAIELLEKIFRKEAQVTDLQWITQFIQTHSWWDTVDFLAAKIVGDFMKKFPDKIPTMIKDYNESEDMWLQRSTLLFQLKYKSETDSDLLFSQCESYADSKEFFLQKAIGWALREYAKTEPDKVYEFVDTHQLSNLSKREANKHRYS